MNILSESRGDEILKRALKRERISTEDALFLYNEVDFIKIMAAAREIRNHHSQPNEVTYTMFRVVNYTNFCNVDCNFCSFYETPNSKQGYTLTREQIVDKMKQAVSMGAEQMFLQGGVNEKLDLDYYTDIIKTVKQEVGEHIHIRAFSPVELLAMEKISKKPLQKVLDILKQAGLDSVPGAGAEILTERMRKILSPKKSLISEWARVMQTCHRAELKGSANIVFGSVETREEVIEHLELIRNIQDETGGFLSFIPWTFQQQTKKFETRTVGAPEYLKVLGICRIFLDNINNMETSVMVLGPGTSSIALHAGANDISSVIIEENVLKSHGFKDEQKAKEFIENSGFQAVKRNLLYEKV